VAGLIERSEADRQRRLDVIDTEADAPVDQGDDPTVALLERLVAVRADRSWRSTRTVAEYSAAIGSAYGLGQNLQNLLLRAALFLDLGNWAVPASELAASERLLGVATAPGNAGALAAYEVLSPHSSPILRLASEICLARNEHWNGAGGPRGLREEAIPLSARIVAVADALERMESASHKIGRADALNHALQIVEADAGEQFDPEVVAALRRVAPALHALSAISDTAGRRAPQ